MNDKTRSKYTFRYEEYKLAYAALMLCYPLGLENLDGEIWKTIPYGNGRYEVSNCGRVKSSKRHEVKIMKPSLHNWGYLYVELFENGKAKKFKVHRLVAEAFIPNPENKPMVDHIFNNKFDNYFENLRWVTASENNYYAYETGASKSGEESYQAKLSNLQAQWCRSVYIPRDKDFGAKALGKKFGVDASSMLKVVNGESYKYNN